MEHKEQQMQEESIPFMLSGSFEANPHLYDYLHRLSFSPSGTVEMVDGAGQVLNSLVRGRFSLQAAGQNAVLVQFFDLVELNPYDEQEKRRGLDAISVKLTRQEGIFAFKQQVIWSIRNEQEWPCLLYRRRYVFEDDPLTQVLSSRAENLYYLLEAQEPDTNFYYRRDDGQRLTARELSQMRISFP
jgi:hypothetical protein